MRLSQSHDQSHEFDKLNKHFFFSFLFMRLSQSHNPEHEFSGLTQFVLYIFLINFFNLILQH